MLNMTFDLASNLYFLAKNYGLNKNSDVDIINKFLIKQLGKEYHITYLADIINILNNPSAYGIKE